MYVFLLSFNCLTYFFCLLTRILLKQQESLVSHLSLLNLMVYLGLDSKKSLSVKLFQSGMLVADYSFLFYPLNYTVYFFFFIFLYKFFV